MEGDCGRASGRGHHALTHDGRKADVRARAGGQRDLMRFNNVSLQDVPPPLPPLPSRRPQDGE